MALLKYEIEKGDIEEGMKWAKHTYQVNKNVPASITNLAKIYVDIGDDETARNIIEDGIASNPDIPEYRKLKAETLLRDKKFNEARAEASKLIEINPESPLGYKLMGDIFIHEGDWDKAEIYINQADEKCEDKNTSQKTVIASMDAFVDYKKGYKEVAKEKWIDMLENIVVLEKEGKGKDLEIFKSSIYAAMGETEEALKSLNIAKDQNWLNFKGLEHPVFEGIQNNPEFKKIMEQLKHKSDSLKLKVSKVST